MARYDAAGTASDPATSGPKDGVRIRWERELESGVGGSSPPIVVGDALYAVGYTSIVGLERESGDVRFERGGYSYLSGPTRAEADAYRSDVLAVRSNEGVYGLSADGGYEVLGRSVGLERWYSPGSEPAVRTSSNPTEPSPVASDGTIYAIVPDTDRVVALDANSGRLDWEFAFERGRGSNRPAVRDGTVYATSALDRVVALDAETGEREWDVELEPKEPEDEFDYRELNPPTATAEGLVVPSRRAVSLLDSSDGSLEWEYVHGGNATESSVAVADGRVFVADGGESLHAVDLETGEEVWTADYRLDASPVVAGDTVYVGYFWLPEIVAFDARTGERRWTYEVPASTSQPVVVDGVLYVVANDRVLALEEAT